LRTVTIAVSRKSGVTFRMRFGSKGRTGSGVTL